MHFVPDASSCCSTSVRNNSIFLLGINKISLRIKIYLDLSKNFFPEKIIQPADVSCLFCKRSYLLVKSLLTVVNRKLSVVLMGDFPKVAEWNRTIG